MIGRGIDQILPHPGDPTLHEPHIRNATEYVRLAELACGVLPRQVAPEYVWGDALDELRRMAPDATIINLETAVTVCEDYDRVKEVHYRMHPANVGCLAAAGIRCCALANNHVLDWGERGLEETLDVLAGAGLAAVGAGRNVNAARTPAVFEIPGKARLLVFACGSRTAGVPVHWGAGPSRPGVWLIDECSTDSFDEVAAAIHSHRQPGDIVVLSIHWGSNWGYRIPDAQRRFAHRLIDEAGVDVIHGHSSHHVRGSEVYRGRPVFYGCGDLLTDYEGIGGYEEFRGDLGLMYFVSLDPVTGSLREVEMSPMHVRRFRLGRASADDAAWLSATLNREGAALGTRLEPTNGDRLSLLWR